MGNIGNMDDKLEKYWRRLFYMKSVAEPTPLDPDTIEYFGIFSIDEPNVATQKRWYIYYGLRSERLKVLERIRKKYGNRNVREIFLIATFSGVGFHKIVREYFSNLKWFTSRNLLEAPLNSYYNDERLVKTVSDLHNKEQKRIFDYIMIQHDWFRRYNDQKPPPAKH
ncbi:uncharacterized protein LOC117137607 isoform X2 [Drosophila mauritiana]|uniref:Uncharacterized protein LOC117137607 isoform X2 n=1 Tax=Drosophila mauritiana TaxID=7226 RepID=A0A6P8JQT6_DROMA|nr:uncharacterized protein LOC117137607 isoform X2 [Drosophila mauritiana]